MTRIICAALVLGLARVVCGAAATRPSSDLRLEVAALDTLNELELSAPQRKALAALASNAGATDHPAAALPAEKAKALSALRDALISGDEQKIAEAHDQADDADAEDDDAGDLTLTATARANAPATLKLLTPGQIAAYLAQRDDDIPDAVATLMDAVQLSHDQPDSFDDIKTQACEQVGVLVAGVQPEKAQAAAQKVAAFLEDARAIDKKDLETHHAELEAKAKAIAGDVDPMEALRHWLEKDLAELLSNPELKTAMEEMKVHDPQ